MGTNAMKSCLYILRSFPLSPHHQDDYEQGSNVADLDDKRLHILDDTLYISDVTGGQEVSLVVVDIIIIITNIMIVTVMIMIIMMIITIIMTTNF